MLARCESMELREAVEQIGQIHEQMARCRLFRGYRSSATALTGVVALAAAGAQAIWLPEPAGNVGAYLLIWIAAAAVSLAIESVTITTRYVRSNSVLERETTLCAVQQLIPSL